MTNGTTPRTSGADWPPGRTKPPAPRGAPEQSDAFAGVLDQHQARTATAEGPKRDGHDNVRPTREDSPNERALERRDDSAGGTQVHGNEAKPEKACETTPETSAEAPAGGDTTVTTVVAEPVTEPVSVSELIALIGALSPASGEPDATVTPAAATAAAPTTNVSAGTPAVTASPQAVMAAGAAVSATAATTATTAETAANGAAATATATAAATAEAGTADIASPEVPEVAKPVMGDAKTQDAPRTAAKPASLPADSGAAGYKQPGTGAETAGSPARPAAPAAGERAAAPAAPAAAAPAQQQQQQQPSGAAGTVNTPQAPAVSRADAAPLASGVPLSRAAETVEHILRLAASRGGMQARVSLKPAELGSLEVVIRQTAGGLTARVVAEDAGAAQVLQQAGAELRRSLEAQGITLLNLDIGQSGGERTLSRSSDGAHAGGYEGGSRGESQNRSGGTVAADDDISTETTVRLPNGALVDVLA